MPFDRKEYMKQYNKDYRVKNKEKKNKIQYEYHARNPHIKVISGWKTKHGIELRPNEDWLSVYLYWKTCERCELCDVKLTDGRNESTSRNLDHDHDTKYIRDVLCWGCNIKRR